MKIIHISELDYNFCNGIKTVISSLYKEQEKLGHTVFVLNLINNEKKVFREEYYIDSLQTFRKTVQQIKPDIVIFHSIYKFLYFGFATYLSARHIPYLIEPHGGTTYENQKKSYWKKKLANILWGNKFIKEASAIIYLNQKEQNNCIFSDKRKRYAIIPNGVSITTPLTSTTTDQHKIRFMFLARLNIHHKGIDFLLDAIHDLCKKGYSDKFEFHFYGGINNLNDQSFFEHRLTEIKKEGNVFYHGVVVDQLKEDAFRNADIYVLTSRYEGMPMSVLEALSYGKPCIVTPQTNMQELIETNNCGWITQLNSHSITLTLVAAMKEFPKRKKEYERNTRKAILPYTWNTIADQTISFYQSVIENSK